MTTSKTKKPKRIATEFSFHAPEANSVFVAGDFNDWDPTTSPLERHDDGRWSVTLKLLPGVHEFKFIVDGRWCCRPGCQEQFIEAVKCSDCVLNAFGTMNRFIEVT